MEVESGDSLGPSSNSAFASDASEDSSRESESNSAPTELERAGVESALGQVNDALHNLESQQLLFEAWNGNDSSGCNASTGTVHGSKVMVRQRGEQFNFRTAERNNIDNRIALEVKGSVCETTWTVCTYGYALLGKLTGFPDGIDCPKEWSSWIKGCCLSFISLRDNGISCSVLSQTRSAMSLISKLVFDKDLGEAAIVNSIFRSFARSHIPRTLNRLMWSPNQFFYFYERQPTNEQLTFYELTLKCIVLCMLFSSCRFAELAAISIERSIVTQEAIYLNTKMKTQLQRSFITIAAMRPDQEKICPYRAVLELWRRVKETYPHNDTFLLNTVVKTPLTVNGVRKLARRAMDRVGIPAEFRPYTLKAASISAYSLKGVPEVLIAHHARLSPAAHTPSRSYFKSNISSGMQQIFARPFPEAFSPQLPLNPMQMFQQALVPQPPKSISSEMRCSLEFNPQPPLARQPGEMPSITLNTTGQAGCLLPVSPSHAIATTSSTQNELDSNAIDQLREEKIGKIETTVTIRERETVRSKEITFISDGVPKPN
ncbi:uncharacterized protein MONOS_1466 [Monocercomonoides exilis]|uniref:uncharacterized protein n=1 Tax=Monocercomonoides exilis TaxID=2049356 RepID=UPI00355A394E|nr:hypothetical protein MONOS_1466 [Monocercomonoides exilis]|eukprot:MONOS_1466.1-p1 / transcript=MONOS_1466.1 / gene=MONOS_1466 / organism=Monocercomonoides_exilis_PA203 / gene_product=unspecified product / transcript_product=unspecified product / location=Mono_scaffold00026:61923-63554(+) / protein_length=544 / sequence_SO=supercontig / SO=protein_coding / is_pseudo=false